MKKIISILKAIWEGISEVVTNPMFVFGFPFGYFAVVVFIEGGVIPFVALVLWIATIIANTNEEI